MLGTEQTTTETTGSLPMPLHIYVVSNTPGRLRFRVAHEYRHPETLSTIAKTLKSFSDQISAIRTTLPTGSITVYYAGNAADFNTAMTTLEQFGMVVVDVPTGRSKVSTKVTDVLAQANQWLEFKTEGAMDLRALVPLIFGLLALKQLIAKSPGINTAPWYIFAWYAFDSFIKLNLEIPAASPGTVDNAGSQ